MKILYLVLIIMFMFISSVYARSDIMVDLEKLSPHARNEILDMQKGDSNMPKPDEWKKWAEIGKGIGLAIGETAKVLNTEVNAFVKTPAGMITVGLITYKVIGQDIKRIVLGIPFWMIVTTLIILSFRRFHMTERVVIKNDKKETTSVQYIERYHWANGEARAASAVAHGGAFILLSLVMALIIL